MGVSGVRDTDVTFRGVGACFGWSFCIFSSRSIVVVHILRKVRAMNFCLSVSPLPLDESCAGERPSRTGVCVTEAFRVQALRSVNLNSVLAKRSRSVYTTARHTCSLQRGHGLKAATAYHVRSIRLCRRMSRLSCSCRAYIVRKTYLCFAARCWSSVKD